MIQQNIFTTYYELYNLLIIPLHYIQLFPLTPLCCLIIIIVKEILPLSPPRSNFFDDILPSKNNYPQKNVISILPGLFIKPAYKYIRNNYQYNTSILIINIIENIQKCTNISYFLFISKITGSKFSKKIWNIRFRI